MKSNYEKLVECSAVEFLKWDQSKIIEKLGLEHNEKYIYIRYIGKQYQVNRLTGEILHVSSSDEFPKIAEHNEAMPIYDILCNSKENARLSHEWKPFQGLSSSPIVGLNTTSSSMLKQFEEHFTGRLPELKEACIKIGGKENYFMGDLNFVFDVFPFFPLQLQFWDCDDEFPAEIVILMDINLLDFIHFETAWFIVFHLLNSLKDAL